MKIDEVKNRTIKVKGKNKIDMVPRSLEARRDPNFIPEEEKHESEFFDDFFDYEKEIVAMKPSRELANIYSDDIEPEPEPDHQPVHENSFVVMEEDESSGFIVMEEKEKYLPTKFKQCVFVKDNEERCKRQAPKTSEYCKAHRKMLKIE